MERRHCNRPRGLARRPGPAAALALAFAFSAAAPAAVAAPLSDLTALSLEQLLDLSVVGASKYEQRQNEVAAAVSVVTRREIEAHGWRTLDEALASLPGVHLTYDRVNTYLGARGFGLPGDYNTRLLITINGNRVNDPIFDNGPAGRLFPLDLDLVDRIEFLPGPGGAVYGQNAMFGVVNVVTRSGASIAGTELSAAARSLSGLREGRATWGRRLDDGTDVVLSVSGMRSRGQDLFLDFGASGVSGTAVGLDGERNRQLFAHAARGAWSFELVLGDRLKNDPTGAYFSDPLVHGSQQRAETRLATLQYHDQFDAGRLDVQGRLFAGAGRLKSPLSYGTMFSTDADGSWGGADIRLVSTAWAGHKWMLGTEIQADVRQQIAFIDVAHPENDRPSRSSGYRGGLYTQDEWQIAPDWAATLGLRVDRNDTTGSHASPRAALIWQASPATTVKALYGRAHRAPNRFERDYSDGFSQTANPELDGEHIDTLEAVVDHRVGSDLTLRASAYSWTMRGLITLGIDPASGLTQYQSGRTVDARGVELSAHRVWPASGLRLRASLSLQDVGYDGGGSPPNSPRVLGKLNVSAPLPWAGLRAGYEWRHDGRRLTLDGSHVGGYSLSNLTLASDALAPGLRLTLVLRNLLDQRYRHPAAHFNWQNALEQDRRSAALQLDCRF